MTSGSEALNNIERGLAITVSLEFKLGAFINYLRSLDALYDLGSIAEDGTFQALAALPEGDLDLVTFIELIMTMIGAKAEERDGSIYYEDDNVEDLFGLETFLYFINASVVLTTTSSDGTPEHTMLGVYMTLGDNEGVEYDKDDPDHEGQQLYSHYYANVYGDYGYVEGQGYTPISDIVGGYDGVRYSYDPSFLYPDEKGDIVREDAGFYVDLSYLGQPGVFINLTELIAFVNGMMKDTSSASEEGTESTGEAVTAANGDGTTDEGFSLPIDLGELLGVQGDLSDSLPLLTSEIAAYIRAFVFGARITSTYIRILVQTDFLDQILTLLTGDFNFGAEFEQSYLGINVDVNNYLYAPLVGTTDEKGNVIAAADHDQIVFSDTRFAIERDDANGMYYVSVTLAGESVFALRDDMSAAELASYDVDKLGYWNIIPIETYLNVNGEYVLTTDASNADWLRAERYEATDDIDNEALIGTYKFYVPTGTEYAGVDNNNDGMAEFANGEKIYVVYPSATQKPFIEARIWLWDHSVSLGINMPTTEGAEYTYTEQAGGDYRAVEKVTYAPDAEIGEDAENGRDYLYYRGNYYQITLDDLVQGNDFVSVTDWEAFRSAPYDGNYYLDIVSDEGFMAYIPITRTDVYEQQVYKTVYEYVGKGEGDYVRNTTSSLISVPEFHADFNQPSADYVMGDDASKYYVDASGNLQVLEDEEYDGVTYVRDDFTFVHSADTGRFTSVSDAREAFFEMWAQTYDDDGDGVVDEGMESEFNTNFSVYLSENFDVYGEDAGAGLAGTPIFYDGEYVNYGDTGELYYINLTIRGSISVSQYKEYLTEEDWNLRFGNTEGWAAAPKYALVRGHYVVWDDAAHAGLKQYGMYAASTSTVQNVLGAIFGDMDALFTVQDGYEATLPFEIRATVMIDYASADEDAYNTLYVAGLELAIDLWRTEADETLTHVLGLYYMSDPMNIGDNNDSNDVLNTSALYLDLSWILGPTAKVKVDLSDYPLETLLNDMVLSSLLGGGEESGTGSSEAVTAAIDPVADPDKATVLLNVFSRSIALKASAGFLKLVIDLIAPDMTNTLEEMLPNLAIHAQIDAAPYDITIGASLFDNEGNGLIDLGITLNLFNTEEKTEGLQIGFGSLESYAEMSAERLAELTKGEATGADYMYYHGMFTRVDEYTEDGRTYYKQGGEGEKGYAPIEAGDDPAKLAEEGKLFVLDNETYYEPLKDNNAVSATPVEDLYVEIPAGYIMLEDADDYAWASGGNYYEKVEAGARLEGGHKYYFLNDGGEFQGLNNYYATWASNNDRALYEQNDSGEYVEVTDTAAIEEGKVYYVRDEKPTEPEEPSGDVAGAPTRAGASRNRNTFTRACSSLPRRSLRANSTRRRRPIPALS